MSLRSLDPTVVVFLNESVEKIEKAYCEGKLGQRVLDADQVFKISEIVSRQYHVNANSAKNRSIAASFSGILSATSIVSSLALNHALAKGNNVKSRFAAIALIVVGIGLATFWYAFRNCSESLSKKVLNDLNNGEENQAIDAIVQGADLDKVRDALIKIVAEGGYAKVFIYLALIRMQQPQLCKKDVAYALDITKSSLIAKIACDLGANINLMFDASSRADIQSATFALDLGADPNRVMKYAENVEVAILAIAHGADITNREASSDLFMYACGTLNNDLIAYLIEQAKSKNFSITEDPHIVKHYQDQNLPGVRYYKSFLPYGDRSPFMTYVSQYGKQYGPLNRQKLTEILKLFGVQEKNAVEIAQLQGFCKELNELKISIREEESQNLEKMLIDPPDREVRGKRMDL